MKIYREFQFFFEPKWSPTRLADLEIDGNDDAGVRDCSLNPKAASLAVFGEDAVANLERGGGDRMQRVDK